MNKLIILGAVIFLAGCDIQQQREIEGGRCVQFFIDQGTPPQDAIAGCFRDGKFDERWWNAVKEQDHWFKLQHEKFEMELAHKYGGSQ